MNELENRSCHLHSFLPSVGIKQQPSMFLNCRWVWKHEQKLMNSRAEHVMYNTWRCTSLCLTGEMTLAYVFGPWLVGVLWVTCSMVPSFGRLLRQLRGCAANLSSIWRAGLVVLLWGVLGEQQLLRHQGLAAAQSPQFVFDPAVTAQGRGELVSVQHGGAQQRDICTD